MAFPYPEYSTDWQTAYTRDDAYRAFGKHAWHYRYLFLACVIIVSGFAAIKLSPHIKQLIATYWGKELAKALADVSVLIAFLLTLVVTYVIISLVRSQAFRFAVAFFTDFYQPPENIEPAKIIRYRLHGKFKLPAPFTMLFQFKYIMAKEGQLAKSDQWPAWTARNLGGPLLLIVFDGCALYIERGNRFSRVVGPGDKIPFLEWYETIKYVVDLRPKVREDKFDVWTKDGIKIEIRARVESRIGDPKKKDPEGKLIYPYDPVAVQKPLSAMPCAGPLVLREILPNSHGLTLFGVR